MGAGSKIVHVVLRVWELICSVIVMALLARFLHLVSEAGVSRDGRIIYALIVACISTVFTIVFMPPFLYAHLSFPADFALFIMWLVAFCLLIARTGVHTCSASWYSGYWSWVWGRRWRRPVVVTNAGCGAWRSVLGFSFMVLFAFLASAILGGIVVSRYYKKDRHGQRVDTETAQITNPPPGGPTTGDHGTTGTAPTSQPGQNVPYV